MLSGLCKGCDAFLFAGETGMSMAEFDAEQSSGRKAAERLLGEGKITKKQFRSLIEKDRFYRRQSRGHATAETDSIFSCTNLEPKKLASEAKELLAKGKITRGQLLVMEAQDRFYHDQTMRGQGNDGEIKHLKYRELSAETDLFASIGKQKTQSYFKERLQRPLR
jgi:hypothetical protein